MTGSEFLEKLNDQQRASYADGAIEMVSYGMEEHKAGCVIDWYYKGPRREQLIRALRQHPELPVTGVLQVLVKRLARPETHAPAGAHRRAAGESAPSAAPAGEHWEAVSTTALSIIGDATFSPGRITFGKREIAAVRRSGRRAGIRAAHGTVTPPSTG